MMLVVLTMTGLGLYLAQRKVAIEAALDLQQDFRNELATLHGVQELRYAALTERCRALVMRPRIHAALEDNALDLLYPTARDELREVLAKDDETNERDEAANVVHAQFYRFLDNHGAVITPTSEAAVGELQPEEEAQLTLPSVPNEQQIGYLRRQTEDGETVDEVIAMPIRSSENDTVIAALVLGLKPVELGSTRARTEIKSGIWLAGRLHLSGLSKAEQSALETEVTKTLGHPAQSEDSFNVRIGGAFYLLFYKQLNPNSLFPPAYEVAVYPLAESLARQQQIRWHVLLAGAALLVGGLLASHLISRRLAQPVEKLAVTSEQYRAQRERACRHVAEEELALRICEHPDAARERRTGERDDHAGNRRRRHGVDDAADDQASRGRGVSAGRARPLRSEHRDEQRAGEDDESRLAWHGCATNVGG